ncbi:MAG TPA: hypothetical protein VMU31_09675, partial [Rhizomicrobium sp.]|nr:hypothetical protein [Rhizomicrobium sp.]
PALRPGLRRFQSGLFVQHFFDRFLASSAILSYAAAGIDVIGTAGAAFDGGADAVLIQPIADTDDHESKPLGEAAL